MAVLILYHILFWVRLFYFYLNNQTWKIRNPIPFISQSSKGFENCFSTISPSLRFEKLSKQLSLIFQSISSRTATRNHLSHSKLFTMPVFNVFRIHENHLAKVRVSRSNFPVEQSEASTSSDFQKWRKQIHQSLKKEKSVHSQSAVIQHVLTL